MNQNQTDFKYLTIALNDHGGYQKPSPKIFDNIPTFISGCKSVEEDEVKTFLTSQDLFFVYSVPHDCKHMETTQQSETIFNKKIHNLTTQQFVSNMNVDACKKTLKNVNIEDMIKNQLIIFSRNFTVL